jgi:hypothetical protein
MTISGEAIADRRLFVALLIGFAGQVGGRVVDLQWHLTHEEFEGAAQQLQAHWLIWLSTVFVLVIAAPASHAFKERGQRRGYLVVLGANAAYGVVAVIHFFQHLDHREVDWAHLLLAITSVAAALGVVWVMAARFAFRRRRPEAVV